MILTAFLPGFIFSFLGSIPPGSINLSILELALKHREGAAYRFAIAAALVEIPYAFIAIEFADIILETPVIEKNLQLLGAIVIIVLGVISLLTSNKSPRSVGNFQDSGFRRGLLISIFNPLAVPFWIGVTTYLEGINFIYIDRLDAEIAYVAGISFGTLALLALVALLAVRVRQMMENQNWIRKVPGYVFLGLGLFALIEYFLN